LLSSSSSTAAAADDEDDGDDAVSRYSRKAHQYHSRLPLGTADRAPASFAFKAFEWTVREEGNLENML